MNLKGYIILESRVRLLLFNYTLCGPLYIWLYKCTNDYLNWTKLFEQHIELSKADLQTIESVTNTVIASQI